MVKLKSGDIVKCVDIEGQYGELTLNKMYPVIDVNSEDDVIRILDDKNGCNFYYANRFLLVENPLDNMKEALSTAVSAIHSFSCTNSRSSLYKIINLLGGEEAEDLVLANSLAAFERYCK